MSWQTDAEAASGVLVGGTDRAAMFYDSTTHTWRFKNQAGTVSDLVSGVSSITNSDGTLTISPTTGAAVASLAAAYKSKIDNWFNKAFYNVLDNGISTANTAAANTSAWTALMSSIVDNATVFFPPSTSAYQFSATCSIPSGKHLKILGGGQEKSIIQTTHATQDIFSCGDWYQSFEGLKFTSSVTRTGGAAILSGNNVAINITNCDFAAMYNGIVFSGGASAGNLTLVQGCNFTNTVNFSIQVDGTNCNAIITMCVADCAPASNVHLEINACGSLLVSDCDFIRATNNCRFNPDSGIKGVFSVYFTNVFFDTSPASSVKFMGGAAGTNVQRVKFVNCWFSGSVTGCEFAANSSTNKPTAIDFINCDIFSNSANGVLGTEFQDIAFSNCRIAGNATAGISVAAISGVTRFNIQNCRIGPTAGVGVNGTGILIAAGTYGGYAITGNDVSGNTTNVTDNGSVTGFNQKQIQDNIGHLIQGQVAASVAASAGINTTETIVVGGLNNAPILANSLAVGDSFEILLFGTCTTTAGNVTTFRVRVGTAGTTADGAIFTAATPAAATTGTAVAFQIILYFTVRTIGGAATLFGHMDVRNTAGAAVATACTGIMVVPTQLVSATVAAFNSTVNNYISVTCQTAAATTTHTFQEGTIVIK